MASVSVGTARYNQARMKKRAIRVGAYIALGLMVVCTVFPIIYMILSSLKSNDEILLNRTLWPTQWHFENYPNMLEKVGFFNYFRNSMIICGFTAVICATLAVFASYALVRFRFPGSGALDIAIIGTQLIPGVMFLLPLYNIFLWINRTFNFQLVNTYHGMILVYTAFFLPVSLFILRSFFATIPLDLEEQGMVDGASRLGAFLRIILPLSVPGIIATIITVFMFCWDELLFSLTLTSSVDTEPIAVGIRLFVGGQNLNRYDLIMAAATTVTLPILLIFFFLQKYMISGLTSGAVKS
ncbi:MAG TPA: carbohydrate ABC transporter permease [Chloroflexia bacterium]|nr:carbohydrate ABC transporter permease [Chloroflexia bacterium]